MNLAELGETFRAARLAAGLTQQHVAVLSGVPRERISLFETGALPELGAVKMLSLFDAVGLEILARRRGHQRTLDDVLADPADSGEPANAPRRVRARAAQRPKGAAGKS
ncbi:helix-turn-helix transcriptional regulator [Paraburkholderia sp. J41]|uniref:helix-turn-helix transcriptional regulator n=1 Tax=Paraburkholderia sp. J41 TaxID=2805433 RepID=UPI002AC35817|nr:helix-turn-helix transcriptional regulator [Paraburkholderia sp. J41]